MKIGRIAGNQKLQIFQSQLAVVQPEHAGFRIGRLAQSQDRMIPLEGPDRQVNVRLFQADRINFDESIVFGVFQQDDVAGLGVGNSTIKTGIDSAARFNHGRIDN